MPIEFSHIPPDLTSAAACASALGAFDRALLAAALGAPADAAIARLLALGAIEGRGESYLATITGPPEIPPARAAQIHRLAAGHHRVRWERGDRAAERPLVAHLTQCCELLLRSEPAALAGLLAGFPSDRLSERGDRQLLRYYAALAAGLADDLGQARAAFRALLGEPDLDPLVRGRALNSGALFAQMQGDLQEAVDAYQESFAIWERLGNRGRQANVLHNLGILHYELHALDQAERQFQAAAAIYAELGDDHHLAMSSNELGLVLRDEGRWEDARASLMRAAAIFEREGASHLLGIVLGNLGEVELAQGGADAAARQLERALALMTSQVYAVDYRINLGLIAQIRGDPEGALAHYQAAGALAEELGRREIMALIAYRCGHALQQLGRADEALQRYHAAMGTIEEIRAPLRDDGLLIRLMGRWQLVYEAAFLLCVERGDHAGAFDVAERARARAFADQLARHADLAGAPRIAPISAAEARAALPPGALMLSYVAVGLRGAESALIDALPPAAQGLRDCLTVAPQLWALALDQRGLHAFACPINPSHLQGAAGQGDGLRFLPPRILARLSEALIAPAEDLVGQAAQVVVVPHGPLHQVPFAALAAQGGPPLAQRAAQLSYAPSATLLLRRRAARGAPPARTCLALGYAGDARGLRHTIAEAAAVARCCAGDLLSGQPEALRELRERAGGYRFLHLACHGEFNLEDPLASWLEVGPGERLSAADVIAGLRLSADLVALSACRSGVSRVLRGDEPMGLARAFLGAGARAVLVTLWPVEDSSARLLMERFYRELLSDPAPAPAGALRTAQLFLRDLGRAQAAQLLGEDPPLPGDRPYDDPRYWGAYLLIGAA